MSSDPHTPLPRQILRTRIKPVAPLLGVECIYTGQKESDS